MNEAFFTFFKNDFLLYSNSRKFHVDDQMANATKNWKKIVVIKGLFFLKNSVSGAVIEYTFMSIRKSFLNFISKEKVTDWAS